MATPEKYAHINFKPPQGARKEAEKSLAWRREFGRGGTAVGIARARDLANGVELSPATVRRMKAFFDRHQKNKSAPGWSPGEDGFPSNGRIAWAMWGSDAGWSWAKKVVEQMNAADEKEKNERGLRPYGSTHGMRPRVYVVHGAPCSGKKDYVAKHLGENDVVFDYDEVMAAISGRPIYQPNRTLVSYCTDIRTLILKKAMQASGVDKTWIITTKVSDDMKSQLSDVPVQYVHIDTPKEECLQRLEQDEQRQPVAEELRKVIEDYFSEGTEEQRRAPLAHPGVERRFLGNFSSAERLDPELLRVEKRSDPETGKPQTYIVGYAARFYRDSLLLGDFVEQIDPGAFEIVKNRQDEDGKPLETRCLFNHDPNYLLGRFPTTMRMTVDDKGLKYECLLPEAHAGIGESISRGDLKGSSFSFVVAEGGERWTTENGQSRRIVTKVKSILDCGPVTYPAYSDASVSVAKRSYEQFVGKPQGASRLKSLEKRADALRARIASESFLAERRDCGRDEGGRFGSGNKCQGDGSEAKETPSKGKASKGKASKGKASKGKASKGKASKGKASKGKASKPTVDPNEPTIVGNALAGAALGGGLGLVGGAAGAAAGAAIGGTVGAVSGAVGKVSYKAKTAINKKISDAGKYASKKLLGRRSARTSVEELRKFLAERRDCGRDESGRFGSGNECQGDGASAGGPPPEQKSPPYMEWKKGDHKSDGKAKKAQEFVDKARTDQLARGGKSGGKSDDGSGVQTWSKGDSYPWTAKQVGDSSKGGYVQGTHPDGTKTKKYDFPAGSDAADAHRQVEDEIKAQKKKRGERSISAKSAELRAFLEARR